MLDVHVCDELNQSVSHLDMDMDEARRSHASGGEVGQARTSC
jgi:hypothetical protein